MRVVPDLEEVVQNRASVPVDANNKIGTTRVDVKHVEQKTFEAADKT